MMTTQISDAELMQRFVQQGDREALGILFERHAGFAFGAAYAVLRRGPAAEEAVQEAFARLIARASAYDPERPFQPWLRTLVVRTCLDQARSEKRRRIRETSAAETRPAPEDPSMRMIDDETRERLNAEVDALPEELRLPLVLHYQTGCSYEEVAEALGCPEGTVATRLASARERLKTRLATAGVLLAAGLSLEDALGDAAPAAPALPPTLSVALQALAATAGPTPRRLPAPTGAPGLLRRPALAVSAALPVQRPPSREPRPHSRPLLPRPRARPS